jgi:hypothetical protein
LQKGCPKNPSTSYKLLFDIHAPTTKAVGSENVTKFGTDSFSRRTKKKEDSQTFETAYFAMVIKKDIGAVGSQGKRILQHPIR